MEIRHALAALDPKNDDQWTADGLPRVDVVANMTGDKALQRQDITDADPEFTREKALTAAANSENSDDEPDTQQPAAEAAEDAPADGGEAEAPGIEAAGDDAGATEAVEAAEAPEMEEQPEPEEFEGPTIEEILELTPAEVLNSPDLMEAYISAASAKSIELAKVREEATEQLKVLGFRQELVSQVLAKHQRANPSKEPSEIQRYIQRQAEARAVRAERAQAFIKAGTSATDVAEQLRVGSKLDQAMRQRKPSPGSTRPDPRLPLHHRAVQK